MNKDTITIKSIRAAAQAYADRGGHRISLRLRGLASRCDAGEISPEDAIEEFRRIENQHRIPFETRQQIALQIKPRTKAENRTRYPSMTALVIIAIAIVAAISLAWNYLP